jgi:hypothetical protein
MKKLYSLLLLSLLTLSICLSFVSVETVKATSASDVKLALWCRVQDYNSTFLTQIKNAGVDRLVIHTALIDTDGSLNLSYTSTELNNFMGNVSAQIPDMEYYATVYSHRSTPLTEPDISTTAKQDVIIGYIENMLESTYGGVFDGVEDDLESWSDFDPYDLSPKVQWHTHMEVHMKALGYGYEPFNYYTQLPYVNSTHISSPMYDSYAYNFSTTPNFGTALDRLKTDADKTTYYPAKTGYTIWLISNRDHNTGVCIGNNIADQLGFLDTKFATTEYPKLTHVGIWWYYSTSNADWSALADWFEGSGAGEEPEGEPELGDESKGFWRNGFEEGSLTAWSGSSGTVSVQDSIKYKGSYSASITSTGSYASKYFYESFTTDTTFYCRFYIYFSALPASGTGSNLAYFLQYSTPRLYFNIWTDESGTRFNLKNSNTSSSAYGLVNAETWYCMEIKLDYKDEGTQTHELYLDGVNIINHTETVGAGTNRIWLANNDIGASFTVYYDNVVLSTSYIGEYVEPLTCATPTFSPIGGAYNTEQTVTLSCATSGATIRYTVDGSTPDSSSILYTDPFIVSSNITIKAKAFKTDYVSSSVNTSIYTIYTGTFNNYRGISGYITNMSMCEEIAIFINTNNLSVYRVSFNPSYVPYSGYSHQYNTAYIDYLIANTEALIIVDANHIWVGQTSATQEALYAIANWSSIRSRLETVLTDYGNNSRVAIETINEFASPSWTWRNQELVDLIRGVDTVNYTYTDHYTNKIVANVWSTGSPYPTWSQSKLTDPLFETYMGIHLYFNSWSPSSAQTQLTYALGNGYKIICTEIGAESDESFTQSTVDELTEFMIWCDANNIGYCIWMNSDLNNYNQYETYGFVFTEPEPEPEIETEPDTPNWTVAEWSLPIPIITMVGLIGVCMTFGGVGLTYFKMKGGELGFIIWGFVIVMVGVLLTVGWLYS